MHSLCAISSVQVTFLLPGPRMALQVPSASPGPPPAWTPIPAPPGICGLPCAFPGFLRPRCQDTCSVACGHAFDCRCAVHAVDAFAPPRTLPLRGKLFRDLLSFLRSHNAQAFALPLKRAGFRSPEDLCRAKAEQLIALGLPASVIRAAGLDPFALPSFYIPAASAPGQPPGTESLRWREHQQGHRGGIVRGGPCSGPRCDRP